MRTSLEHSTRIDNTADLRRTFAGIRDDGAGADTRDELTHLYRHAEALIALTYSPAWQKKFGDRVEALRQLAETEFATTAGAINQRAAHIGTKSDYDETWGGKQRVYGNVNNVEDLRQIFTEIREAIAAVSSREELTTLYRRAEYLIALTYAPAWQKKFGDAVGPLRQVAETEFTTVARAVNHRATQLGTAADYDETWGGR